MGGDDGGVWGLMARSVNKVGVKEKIEKDSFHSISQQLGRFSNDN